MWSVNILVFLCAACLQFAASTQEWEFLMYTQHWPATLCRIWMDKSPSHTCAFPQHHDAWAIHGIWPSVTGQMGPSFCNHTWLFDPKEVRPIESELEQGWINVENGTPLYSLWAHEWNKHGTCAATIEPFNSQIKYFSKGLDWLQKYSMSTILSEANILPSESKQYTVQDFHNAIKSKLGVEPDVQCKFDHHKQYLFELRICFTKTLELMDCRASKRTTVPNTITNCNPTGITYAESVKPANRLLVQLYKLTSWLQWLTL